MHRRSDRDLEERRSDISERQEADRRAERRGDLWDFWRSIGVDVEGMSPRAQLTTSLAVLVPVVVGYLALLALFPAFWWMIFVVGWVVFPAFGLLLRGVAGLSEGQAEPGVGEFWGEELLGALRERGELTPTQAAMETSLTVAEADKMLKELAAGGHLDVRVRGGGLFYALWDRKEEAPREL